MTTEPDDTDGVEALLNRFRAAVPPEELMERLRAARPVLTAVPAARRVKVVAFPFWPHLTAAAAAIVAGVATWHWMQPPAEVPGVPLAARVTAGPEVAGMAPQQSTQRLMGVRDMGITRDELRRPVRLMHATWIDDDVYPLTGDGPPVREARVREEIVPVVLTDF